MQIHKLIISIGIVGFLLTACKKEAVKDGNTVITLATPKGFPYPTIPVDNQPTENRIALGKKLFFDPILSRDSSLSCSSCHLESYHFAEPKDISIGIENRKGIRNAPSILNSAWLKLVMWDGGIPTLEQQILAPIDAHFEFDFDPNEVVKRLAKQAVYVQMTKAAYNTAPSIFTLTRSIACFERTLTTGRSKFDEYQYYNNTTALSFSEKSGMDIFFGEKGECFHCHNEYNFTDNEFRNNGLYTNYVDSGRARITLNSDDVGKFKVPSLRNVAGTAPYMHDGSLATLEQVVEHYNSGGKSHPNKSPFVKPLGLTATEKEDLVNFLKALTDQ